MTPPDSAEVEGAETLEELRRQLARAQRRYERERDARRASERIAEEAMTRLYEANKAKTVFLATISHELRTPLTSIAGFTALLRKSWEVFQDEQKLDFLERVHRNTGSLQRLIEEVLDFTRLESEEVTLGLRPARLDIVVASILDDLCAQLETHVVHRRLSPVRASVDVEALRRVLTNLLSNAARYSEPGTTLTVEVGPSGDDALLVVEDEGPGVPADEREQIFEPFFRGYHPHVIRTHGSGIGLTVVRRFVEMMEGTVRVRDGETSGARFEIRIPRFVEEVQGR